MTVSARDRAAQFLLAQYPHYFYKNNNDELKVREGARFNDPQAIARNKARQAAITEAKKIPHNSPQVCLDFAKKKIQEHENKLSILLEAVQEKKYIHDLPRKNSLQLQTWRTLDTVHRQTIPTLQHFINQMKHFRHEMVLASCRISEPEKQDRFDRQYDLFVNFMHKADQASAGIAEILARH